MTDKENPIEQAAVARRERLLALRTANELLNTPEYNSAANGVEEPEKAEEMEDSGLKFRNYLPHDERLQEGKLPPAVLPKFEDPIVAVVPTSEKIEDPFLNIAPKKPNWDLKRDVQKKLDKLERRTQKAIYMLALEQEKERQALEKPDGVVED